MSAIPTPSLAIVIVSPTPKERLSLRHDLDVVGVDVMTLKNRPLLITKIPADHADRVHLRKKARAQPKMRARAAQNLLPLPKWRLKRVKRYRADYC